MKMLLLQHHNMVHGGLLHLWILLHIVISPYLYTCSKHCGKPKTNAFRTSNKHIPFLGKVQQTTLKSNGFKLGGP